MAAVGVVAIELIAVGDLVWVYDDTTGDAALKEVVQTFENETYELTTVRTNDGQEIVSTPEHPYFVQDRGWVLAKDLRAGDILLNVNGQEVVVEQVQHEILENPITVYNFEVAGIIHTLSRKMFLPMRKALFLCITVALISQANGQRQGEIIGKGRLAEAMLRHTEQCTRTI